MRPTMRQVVLTPRKPAWVLSAEKCCEIFEAALRVASGARSKSELLGYADAELVPWQVGAPM